MARQKKEKDLETEITVPGKRGRKKKVTAGPSLISRIDKSQVNLKEDLLHQLIFFAGTMWSNITILSDLLSEKRHEEALIKLEQIRLICQSITLKI